MKFKVYPTVGANSEVTIELSNGNMSQPASFEVLYSDEDRKLYGKGVAIEVKPRDVLLKVAETIKSLDDVKAVMTRGRIVIERE